MLLSLLGSFAILGSVGSLYDLTLTDIDDRSAPLKRYKGKVLMIVNTASKCGFTPQYEGLEKLYETYKSQGFEILGFPSNDFGEQEPGTSAEIKAFCKANYGVTFPLFKKAAVSGDKIQPVFKYLTEKSSEGIKGSVKWNFTKFLVNRKGEVIARYGSMTSPTNSAIKKAIEKSLAEK